MAKLGRVSLSFSIGSERDRQLKPFQLGKGVSQEELPCEMVVNTHGLVLLLVLRNLSSRLLSTALTFPNRDIGCVESLLSENPRETQACFRG